MGLFLVVCKDHSLSPLQPHKFSKIFIQIYYLCPVLEGHEISRQIRKFLIIIFDILYFLKGAWGSVVVKALRYYSDGLRIDSRWCHWGYFRGSPGRTMCPEVDSASESEYQGFLLE